LELGEVEPSCRWKEKRLRETLANVLTYGVQKPEDQPPPGVPPVPPEPPAAVTEPPTFGTGMVVASTAEKPIDVLYVDCAPIPANGAVLLSDLLASLIGPEFPEGSELDAKVEKACHGWQGYQIIASRHYSEHCDVLVVLEARSKLLVAAL
jgi:hypothetical protein